MAIKALHSGGVIAYPTEAVYGLGCLPHFWPAVSRILTMKKRPVHKGLIMVAATIDQLLPYVEFPDKSVKNRVLATWPGPVTWLLPARPIVPDWVRGSHDTVAVRVSDHPVVQSLCRQAGPLISTSANPAGLPPARSALKVRTYFPRQLDYILTGKLGNQDHTTEIRHAGSGKIIRPSG